MLPAAERLPDAPMVIDQCGYFVVHAPRQTGKTTTLRALAEKLTAEGRYAALHFSCEAGEVAGDDYVQAQRALLDDLRLRAEVALPADLRPPRWPGDGHELRYELKKTWRDGARFVRFDPYELIARICAMVPPPRFHMVRFHGVLAPNAKLREQVVASAKPYVPPQENTVPNPVQLPLFGKLFDEPKADVMYARRKPWAWLLRHVFAIDVTHPSKVRRSNEVASSSIDGRRDTRGFGTGEFVGARSTETQEGAHWGNSRCHFRRNVARERRCILPEFALVFAGATAYVCPRVKKIRRRQTLTSRERARVASACANAQEPTNDASSAKLPLCLD